MGDMADMANDDRMSEWELAKEYENAPMNELYELGLCDEHGVPDNPGHVVGDNMTSVKPVKLKPSGKGKCPLCSSNTRLVDGKFGKFYGCVFFPRCKGSRNI